jgi:hypothetical protein
VRFESPAIAAALAYCIFMPKLILKHPAHSLVSISIGIANAPRYPIATSSDD